MLFRIILIHLTNNMLLLFFFLICELNQAVYAHIYKYPVGGSPLEIIPLEETNGVWSTKGPKTWEGCYYMYEVSVYHPSTLHIEKCYANDPYARGYAGSLSQPCIKLYGVLLPGDKHCVNFL